jgi:hypothetical protein
MADITQDDKTNLLFKSFLNLPFNKPNDDFTQEYELNTNTYTFGDKVFIDTAPQNPDFSTSSASPYNNSTNGQHININYENYYKDPGGIVEKFENLELQVVSSGATPESYTVYYNDTRLGNVPLLRNAFQFTYNIQGSTFPYNYTLYDGTNIVNKTNYVFDFKTGYITLYGYSPTADLYLTFVRYCGEIGVNNLIKRINNQGITISDEDFTLILGDSSQNIINVTSNDLEYNVGRDKLLINKGYFEINDSERTIAIGETSNNLLNISGTNNELTFSDLSGLLLDSLLTVQDDTILNSRLHVSGATTLDDTLDVSGATTLNDALDVSGATTLEDSLSVTKATTLNDTLAVTKATTLNDTLAVTKATTLNDTLSVTKATTLNDTLSVTKATTLNDTLAVTKATTLNDTLAVTKATTLDDTLSVTKATTLNDTLSVTKATTLDDTLDVSGATTLNDTLDVSGATTLNDILDVSGATTLNDTLDVAGQTNLNNITIINNSNITSKFGETSIPLDISTSTTRLRFQNGDIIADVSNTVHINGNTTISKNLTVEGNLFTKGSVTQLNTTEVTISDNLITLDKGVHGTISFEDLPYQYSGLEVEMPDREPYKIVLDMGEQGTEERFNIANGDKPIYFRMGISGDLQAIATRVDDISDGAIAIWDASNHQFTYRTDFISDRNFNLIIGDEESSDDSRKLNIHLPTYVSKTLDVSGATTLNDTLDVSGATTLRDTLDVSGATTLNDTLDVSGATTLNDTLDVSGATTLNDILAVTKATTLNDTLDVSNATTLRDTLDVSNATTLHHTLDVSNATTLRDTLDVSNATTLHDTLDVSNATTLHDTLDVSNATTLHDTLDVSNATTLHDTLDVSGATTLHNTLDVSNATTLHDTLMIKSTTNMESKLTISYENVNIILGDNSENLLDISSDNISIKITDTSGLEVNTTTTINDALTVSADSITTFNTDISLEDETFIRTDNKFSYPDAEEDPEFVRYRNLSDLERLMVGLTEAPPRFDFDLSDSDTVSITIEWSRSQIYTDLSFEYAAATGTTSFPNVQSIGLDIQVGNGDWKTHTRELNKDAISFIFQTGQTYGDITITNPDQSFNARIYPINAINRSRPATSNYLLFSDLSIKPAGSPAQPTIASFTEPTNTAPYQLSVITRSPNDFDINTDGNQSIPPLSHVRYKIQLKDQSSTKRMITIPSGQFDLLNTYEFTLDSVFTQLSTDMPTNSIALTSGPFSSIFLYYDTSYSIVTEVKNNGNDGTTPYSVESIKSYFTTGLPLPSSFGTTNPTITDNIQRTNGYVSRDKYIHGENSEKPSYLNIYYDAWNFRFNNNNGNNTFVVNPNDPGKDVDQSGGTKTTLSTVRTYYELTNGSQLQLSKADYYGYESSTGSIHTPDITINSNFPLVVVSTSDMATGNNQGYFIKGEFSPQQDFSGGYVNTFTGINPSRNVYKIGYDISINNGTDYFLNQEFILDDLSGAPTLSIDSSSILITSTETMYGIPSVTDYEVSLTATGSNLSRKVLPQHSYGLSISIDGNSENYTITLGQETITKNKRRTFSLPDSNNSGTKQYTSNISANSFNILTNANIESTPTITDTIRSSNVWYRDYFSLHRIDSAPTTYYAQTDTDGKTPFDSEFYTGNTLSLKDKQTTIVGESIYQALFKDGGFTSKSGDYIDYSSQGYETQYSNGNSFTFPDYSGLTTFPKYVIQVFNDGSKHDKTIKLNGNLLTHTSNADVSVNIICSDTIGTISNVSNESKRRTTLLSPYIVNGSGSAGAYFDESNTGTGCIDSNDKLILPTALAYTIVIIRLTNEINKQLNITFV